MGANEDLYKAIIEYSVTGVEAALETGADPNYSCSHSESTCTMLEVVVLQQFRDILDMESFREIETKGTKAASITSIIVGAGVSFHGLIRAKSCLQNLLDQDNVLVKKNMFNCRETWTTQMRTIDQKLATAEREGQKFIDLLEGGGLENPDMKFVWDDGTTLLARQEELAAASPVLATSFSERWEESNPDGVLKPHFSVPVMKAVLAFIYTGWLPPFQEEPIAMIETMAAGDFYQMPALKKWGMTHLKSSLSLATLTDFLIQGHLHGLSEAKAICFDFICKNKNWARAFWDTSASSIKSIEQEHPDLWVEMGEALSNQDK